MTFGKDFFKILNIVIQLMRMFAKVFGTDEDKKAAVESEARTANSNPTDTGSTISRPTRPVTSIAWSSNSPPTPKLPVTSTPTIPPRRFSNPRA